MIVFAHIEKTAGMTLREILRRHFGPTQCDLYSDPREFSERHWRVVRLVYPRLHCLAGHACMPFTLIGEQPDARIFTFLRDPVERALSSYQYGLARRRKLPPFHEWARLSANVQTLMLAGRPDLDAAIRMLEERIGFVGLVDRFDESMVLWKHWLEIPGLDHRYVSKNVMRDSRIKEEIRADPEKMDWLRKHNALDAGLLDHVRERVYPAQQARFGPSLEKEIEAFEASLDAVRPSSRSARIGRCKRNLIFRPIWKLAT